MQAISCTGTSKSSLQMLSLMTQALCMGKWRMPVLKHTVAECTCSPSIRMHTCSALSFSLSLIMALASATLFFMPPDSSPGKRGSTPDSPTAFRACATSSYICCPLSVGTLLHSVTVWCGTCWLIALAADLDSHGS